jgi:L-lactate dehydrogenase (FMN-dependent) and related alpha-hydroxy acid dehydrogenases
MEDPLLHGSRSPFDRLTQIVYAVGDKVDVIGEGGIQKGTHMLQALSIGAKARSGGRLYLYAPRCRRPSWSRKSTESISITTTKTYETYGLYQDE